MEIFCNDVAVGTSVVGRALPDFVPATFGPERPEWFLAIPI